MLLKSLLPTQQTDAHVSLRVSGIGVLVVILDLVDDFNWRSKLMLLPCTHKKLVERETKPRRWKRWILWDLGSELGEHQASVQLSSELPFSAQRKTAPETRELTRTFIVELEIQRKVFSVYPRGQNRKGISTYSNPKRRTTHFLVLCSFWDFGHHQKWRLDSMSILNAMHVCTTKQKRNFLEHFCLNLHTHLSYQKTTTSPGYLALSF